MQTEKQNLDELDDNLKAVIKILNTSSKILLYVNNLLKPHKLTFQQYLVLRLAMAAPQGISVKFISSNMLDASSNTSRIVDKLEEKKLVRREQSQVDKRIIHIFLTEKGLTQITQARATLSVPFTSIGSHFASEEVATLTSILDKLNTLID